jgi:hypothetical protein
MVYDIDQSSKDFIGTCESTIGKLMGSQKQTWVSDLTQENQSVSRGKIIIRVDNVHFSNDEARFKISANVTPFTTFCCGGINNPYYLFSRARSQ